MRVVFSRYSEEGLRGEGIQDIEIRQNLGLILVNQFPRTV